MAESSFCAFGSKPPALSWGLATLSWGTATPGPPSVGAAAPSRFVGLVPRRSVAVRTVYARNPGHGRNPNFGLL